MEISIEQQAHEFALAYAKAEYQRRSEFELTCHPKDVEIHNFVEPLNDFSKLYNDAKQVFLNSKK